MPDALLNLPWQIQLSLASGYAAYLLCYVGIRAKHTAVDVTFLTLTFGLIATGVYFLVGRLYDPCYQAAASGLLNTCLLALGRSDPPFSASQSGLGTIFASFLAFISACTAGIFWRRYLRKLVRYALRASDVSWIDDDPSALASIVFNSDHRMSQLSVLMEDGTWLICKTLNKFDKSPFGPCKIGTDGDVAMYVTHTIDASGVEKEFKTTKDADYGDRITFIPASKIKRMNFRHIH